MQRKQFETDGITDIIDAANDPGNPLPALIVIGALCFAIGVVLGALLF